MFRVHHKPRFFSRGLKSSREWDMCFAFLLVNLDGGKVLGFD